MLLIVLSLFVLGALAPFVWRRLGRAAGWLLAAWPFAVTVWLGGLGPAAVHGQPVSYSYAWVPALDVTLSFRLDALALLFALLVTGIGALILVYAGGYMGDQPGAGRLHALLLCFMASMLGVVTCNSLLGLYVFWELTSLTSYLLIGFEHDAEKSRKAALQALLVTAGGGLALLPGLLLLGATAGTFEIDRLTGAADRVVAHRWYPAMASLILAGAFTKSAQVPFHFWLPSAMQAPTPVSAYLHSATMVKAGVFLVARLTPVLGGTLLWNGTLQGGGALTMLVAAFLATQQTDLKRLLAYTTVATLGMLIMLLGEGTPAATKAAMVLVVSHGLYKGGLFMVAGIVDHETGTRDILHLRGLWSRMPVTTVAAALAALSAAGLVPFFGFIAKETTYAALLERPWLLGAAVLANAFGMLIAVLVGWQVFYGERARTPRGPHDPASAMWLGPMALGIAGLALGVFAWSVGPFFSAATTAAWGKPVTARLALWHGLERDALLALLLSAVTFTGGLAFYLAHAHFLRLAQFLGRFYALGPTRWYDAGLDRMLALARWQTRVLQHGYLRLYLIVVVLSVTVPVAWVLAALVQFPPPADLGDVRPYEALLVIMILAGTGLVLVTDSRLAAVAGLGVVGYGIALTFLLFGAPDLALTQFAIETLSVVLFALVLYRLPRFSRMSGQLARMRDGVVSLGLGAVMSAIVIATTAGPSPSRLAPFFTEKSVAEAFGRNIVNVILVDFRGLDTLGEVTVLAVAALGVFGLLRLQTRLERD